ncbi:MAG: MTH1187 family thiamine-binding protein [Desulfovibrionaceae bacterium]|nr:MTH1187 family thiamine-binding protein [Desulfovibrionaceae bacterium]
MSVLVELSIFPIGQGPSVGTHVARAVEIIRKSGLAHRLGPMGTCIEGEWDEVMAVVGDCYRAMARDCERVYLTLKADARRGRDRGLDKKTASVEEKLKEGEGT